MRRFHSLKSLERKIAQKLNRFERRAKLIQRGVGDGGGALDDHQLEAELGAFLINLQAYWSNWCRSYYLSVALGATSKSNIAVSSALPLTSEHHAMTVAIKGTLTPTNPPPPVWQSRQEPKWFSPDDLAKIVKNAAITGHPLLTVFLQSAPPGISHLRTVRNYYAHRSLDLQKEALALGPLYLVGGAKSPSQILLFVEPGKTVSVLERWILDLRSLSGALCA